MRIRHIDFIIQTIAMVIVLVATVGSFIQHDFLQFLISALVVLQGWQIAGCSISIFTSSSKVYLKRRYILLMLCSTSMLVIQTLYHTAADPYFTSMHPVFIIVPAYSLNIVYYIITWKEAFPKISKGRFLPHLSF